MAAAKVISQGDLFWRMARLLATEAIKNNRTLVSHIYQDQAAKSFNILPEYIRNCIDFSQFSRGIWGVLRSGGGGGVDVTIAQGIKMMRSSSKNRMVFRITVEGVDVIK